MATREKQVEVNIANSYIIIGIVFVVTVSISKKVSGYVYLRVVKGLKKVRVRISFQLGYKSRVSKGQKICCWK